MLRTAIIEHHAIMLVLHILGMWHNDILLFHFLYTSYQTVQVYLPKCLALIFIYGKRRSVAAALCSSHQTSIYLTTQDMSPYTSLQPMGLP